MTENKNREASGRFKKGHNIRKPPSMKRVAKLAEAEELGKLRAQLKAHQKKPLEESAREHIGHLIDNLQIDPMEIVSVIGTTALVHAIIINSEELLKRASQTKFSSYTIGTSILLLGPIQAPIQLLAEWLTGTAAKSSLEVIQALGLENDWEIWLLSFALAYIIVHNAGMIIAGIGSGIGNLTTLIGFLLPAAV